MSVKKSTINYIVGKEYPFTVKAIFPDFCELRDESNFAVYLQHTRNLRLVKGQTITCRVLANTQKRPRIELVQTEDAEDREVLSASTVESIIKPFAAPWNKTDFSRLLLMREKDRTFEDECRSWIVALNNEGCDLSRVKEDVKHFLEETSFLSLCNAAEREFYQERLTVMIELLGYYLQANRLLEDGEQISFIDGMFSKLRSSGYVYHPAKNFNIMSCLFLADRLLMEERMEKLFDIIRQWKIEIWGKEPFNSTLVKILGLYVNENIWRVDRVKDNAALIGNLSQALSIQLMLLRQAGCEGGTEYRLCLARLCMVSSYLYSSSPVQTLSLALSNLLGSSCMVPSYMLRETKDKTVPLRICGMQPKPIDTTSCFIHGKGKLEISKTGIVLHVAQDGNEKPILPAKLGLWEHLQVMADKRSVRALPEKPSIMDCKNLWEDIERDMFASRKTAAAKPGNRKPHKVEDNVAIIITRQDRTDPYLFHCRIDDEIGGEGTISMDKIVPYGLEPEIGHFLSETGENLAFEAVITDKDSDGNFQFSMMEQIKKWAEGHCADIDRMVCILNGDRPSQGKGWIPAVSREGISVQLGGFDEIEEVNFKRGDMVLAAMQSEGTGTFHVFCKVIKHLKVQPFYISSAFHNLMSLFAYEDGQETGTIEEKDLQQSDNILDAAHIREIVRLIDRMSSTEKEYVLAYNYLGFARILCLMVGWEEQAADYRGRMELILMLHDFAQNDVVNQQKMQLMQQVNADIFRNDALLHSKFLQLQTVSYMGMTEHNQDLWEIYSSQEGIVRDIAELVIAYNMVKEKNMTNMCHDLQNRIKQTLRLKGYESNLKIYGNGIEDERTEYKTSIVFPPENMNPDMPKQMRNILRVIASFLNTNGGTLYVGVNDSGAGTGIENDLECPEFYGNKDKYQLTINNAVANEWGNLVASCVHPDFDHENKQKTVLVVKVNPYHEMVTLDGTVWGRMGSSIRAIKPNEYEQFKRNTRLADSSEVLPGSLPSGENRGEDISSSGTRERQGVLSPSSPAAASSPSEKTGEKPSISIGECRGGAISTSQHRENIFDAYSDDFRPHIACLKFLENGKFCRIDEYDYAPGLLALAVYEEEEHAFLVLGYEDGKIAKVPMDLILRFEKYHEYNLSSKSKLVFASIAQPEDAVIIISHDGKNKNRKMVRIDRLSEFEEGTLKSAGERVYKETIGEVIAYEIAPADQLFSVESLMNRNDRSLGLPLASLDSEARSQLSKWHVTP